MARPRKEGMEYFPHDTDASGDEKVDSMRALFGNDGYAFYFILCERIYRTSGAELDISKPVLLKPLVKKLLLSTEQFDEMLDAAFELNLFSRADFEDRGVITSNGIKKRFSAVHGMRDRWRKNKENDSDIEVIHEENPVENPVEKPEETPESKVKQRKEKKTKEQESELKKQYADYVFLTETEYGKLTDLLGSDSRDNYFLRFASWISGQTPRVQKSRSAYLSILNWHREDASKQIPFPRGQQQSKYERTKSKLDQMLREAEGKANEQSGYYQTGTDTFG